MTRELQLAFCKKCVNQKTDFNKGIICSLTEDKANFQDECPNYKLDESIKVTELDDQENVDINEAILELDPKVIEKLRSEQDFKSAIITGTVTAIIGSLLWAAITVSTEYQIGYMAIAIGFGIGYVIREFGKGIDPIFGYLGAILALLSCIFGNILGIIGFVANQEGLSYINTLLGLDYSLLPSVMAESFSPIDLLFYGFAIFEGYKYSFRKITEKEIESLNNA